MNMIGLKKSSPPQLLNYLILTLNRKAPNLKTNSSVKKTVNIMFKTFRNSV